MKTMVKGLAPALLVMLTLGVAMAKMPPAAPMDPVKAEEKKAKDAATAASVAAQQAKAEDRAAARYTLEQKAKGRAVMPQMASNAADMDAKAREAAAKVPGAPAPLAVASSAATKAMMKKK